MKNLLNQKKHKVSFEEAKTVFYDDAILIDEPDHSSDEERFILLGRSSNLRILIVCHCYRESNNVIRIISSRKANDKEKIFYSRRL